MVSGTGFFDALEGDEAPNFRPSLLRTGEAYLYRVQAFVSGNSVSNFTPLLRFFIERPALPPVNLVARPSSPGVMPLNVMLSWDTPDASGVVDRWEIERAVVNNFAAERLNPRNQDELSRLSFSMFRTVYRESSRFRSRVLDAEDRSSPFEGQHGFLDAQVTLGNTLFYRIRAIGTDERPSVWVFRGAKLTDDLFSRKLLTVLSKEEVERYSSSLEPLLIRGDILQPPSYLLPGKTSLLASFANPTRGM